MTTLGRSAGKPVVRDKNGTYLYGGDRVAIEETAGVLKYDPAFWAYAVRGDDGRRYLLMDVLHTCFDPGDGGFAWREIEKVESPAAPSASQ